MFEGPVTGNIPEVLDNGEVTDGTHVTAGRLALALTPYAQVTDLAVNTAASGNNAAAIQSLDDRVTAELASKLDSSALAPAVAPLATGRTGGRARKQHRSAADGVDLKLSNYSTTAAMNGSIASANNATLATVAANYGLKTVVRWTPRWPTLSWGPSPPRRWPPSSQGDLPCSSSEVDSKIATALLDAVTTAALDAALLGKADASALASLLSTVDGLDTPLEVDTKIANAPLSQRSLLAGTPASRRSRGRRDAAGLIRHERRALGQRDHAPERPRRNPRGARRPAAFRQRRSC